MEEYSEARSYLIAAAEELKEYLLSGATTWRLVGPDSFPPLTPGNVLFAMKQLAGSNAEACEDDRLIKALDGIRSVRIEWESSWKKKVKQEIPQRQRLWSNYLNDFLKSLNLPHREFLWIVRWRVILELLKDEIGDQDRKIWVRLNALDDALQGQIASGPFIWDKRLEAVFNREKFWFLYLKIS
jgi:hypothetical protein